MMKWNDKPVYLCCSYTDMRKSINGLMTLVKESFSLDPFADALFVFCNRSRDRLKILEWDGDGFWLYFKRLERGHFRWPAKGDTSTMVLSADELNCLNDGARLEKSLSEKMFLRDKSLKILWSKVPQRLGFMRVLWYNLPVKTRENPAENFIKTIEELKLENEQLKQ